SPGTPPPANPTSGPIASAGVPSIRALAPADLDGNQLVDTIPHSSLRRLVVQAPAGTSVRLTRGGADVPCSLSVVTLSDGTLLHELVLENPIGSQALTLRAGDYTLPITGDATLGVVQPLLALPYSTGALANDLAKPTGALYPAADDVAFTLGGGLPSLSTGALVLRSGNGRAIEVQLS